MSDDDRIRRGLRHVGVPADPGGAFEKVTGRRRRFRIRRGLLTGILVIGVLIGAIGGVLALARTFGDLEERLVGGPAPGPTATATPLTFWEICADDPFFACQWVANVLDRAGYDARGSTGSALIGIPRPGTGPSISVWATDQIDGSGPCDGPFRELAVMVRIRVCTDGVRHVWAAHGLLVWVETQTTQSVPVIGPEGLAPLVRASVQTVPSGSMQPPGCPRGTSDPGRGLPSGYRRAGPALHGDVDGDAEDDEVWLSVDDRRPPRCRTFLILDPARGLPLKSSVTLAPIGVPAVRLEAMAQINGLRGLEIIVRVGMDGGISLLRTYAWHDGLHPLLTMRGEEEHVFRVGREDGRFGQVDCVPAEHTVVWTEGARGRGGSWRVERRSMGAGQYTWEVDRVDVRELPPGHEPPEVARPPVPFGFCPGHRS